MLTSFWHLFVDFFWIGVLFYAATFISHPAVPRAVAYLLWPIYWYAQGSVMTGVWVSSINTHCTLSVTHFLLPQVIAHECGHQSFSDYQTVNNIVGSITHGLLLVPYHAWRITHGKHHNNTGNLSTTTLPPLSLTGFGQYLYVVWGMQGHAKTTKCSYHPPALTGLMKCCEKLLWLRCGAFS